MHEPELLTRTNHLMRLDAEEFTEEYSEEIGRMSGRCIDIGTGAGDVSVDFLLPKLNPNSTLLCSDISKAMVNYGKKYYGDNDRLSFIELDIETPDLPKDLIGQFDHLTSLCCLHWCFDLRKAFENIYSLLKPGGTAFVTFFASFPGLSAFVDLQAMPKYRMYMKEAHRIVPPFQGVERPRQALIALLGEVGFQVKSCSYRSRSFVRDTRKSMADNLLAVSPFETERMPAELKAEYLRDLIREFVKYEIVFNKDPNDEDEFSTLVRYRAFIVYLKKPVAEQPSFSSTE